MNDTNIFYFRIADFAIRLQFSQSPYNSIELLPSFQPFRIDGLLEAPLLFTLTIDDQLRPVSKECREKIRNIETGNGKTTVDRLTDGGYQFILHDIQQRACCLLITNKDFSNCHCALAGNQDMRSFGLSNALMLVFAFASCHFHTLLIHASLVRQQDWGYAFIAQSGTGKSTHVSLWLRYLPNCDLMNDDNPIVRIIDNKAFIYGSPWSGKTPCYRNIRARLGAITHIHRASENHVESINGIAGFAALLPACSSMKWDHDIYSSICDTITRVVETVGMYNLYCRPDREAAMVCHARIHKKENAET